MEDRGGGIRSDLTLQTDEKSVAIAAVIDRLDHDAAVVIARGGDGIDGFRKPTGGNLSGDLIEEQLAVRDVLENTRRGGQIARSEMLAEELFDHVACARKPGDVIVIYGRGPPGIIGGVAHKQSWAGHGKGWTKFFIQNQTASSVQAGTPIVGVLEAPFEDRNFNIWMLGRADIVAEFRQVTANAVDARGEVIGLVLIVVAAEYVEAVARAVDDLLTPVDVAGALLPASNDAGVGNDGAKAVAVKIDDSSVGLRREAVIHGLVVDLEVANIVGLGMPVPCAQAAPLGGSWVVEIVDPVHGIVEILWFGCRSGKDDERFAVETLAKTEILIGAEAGVVRVVAPIDIRVIAASSIRTDGFFPLIGRGKGAAGPADEGGFEITEGVEEVGAEHPVVANIGTHERDEVDEERAMARGDDLDRSLRIAEIAGERNWKFVPVGSSKRKRKRCNNVAIGTEYSYGERRKTVFSLDPKRAFVFGIGLKKEATLPNTCIASAWAKTDALLAILKVELGDFDMTLLGNGFPIGLEVRTFETCAADLFGKETIFHGVIDVLQELTVDSFVDGNRRAVRIHHEHGNAGHLRDNVGERRGGR